MNAYRNDSPAVEEIDRDNSSSCKDVVGAAMISDCKSTDHHAVVSSNVKRFSVWSSRTLAISWRLEASAFHFSTLLPLTYPKIAEVIKQKRAI